jgi:hypothetical protein
MFEPPMKPAKVIQLPNMQVALRLDACDPTNLVVAFGAWPAICAHCGCCPTPMRHICWPAIYDVLQHLPAELMYLESLRLQEVQYAD